MYTDFSYGLENLSSPSWWQTTVLSVPVAFFRVFFSLLELLPSSSLYVLKSFTDVWGNYLSSFFVGVLCVLLFLIHTGKHNAENAAYIVFPSDFFLHPCGLILCCILRVLGWWNRPQNDPKTQWAISAGLGRMNLDICPTQGPSWKWLQ